MESDTSDYDFENLEQVGGAYLYSTIMKGKLIGRPGMDRWILEDFPMCYCVPKRYRDVMAKDDFVFTASKHT